MPSWFPTLITALGLVLTAIISVQGPRLAARLSARAAQRTADAESRQVDVGEWKALLAEFKEQVEKLTNRVDKLETAVREKDARHRSLLSYVIALLAFIRRVAPNEVPPLPPTEFVDELAYITER